MTYLDMSFCTDSEACPKAATCKRNFERIRKDIPPNALLSVAAFMPRPIGTAECTHYWPTEDRDAS